MALRRYDREVAKAWRQIKKPFPFTVDVLEYGGYSDIDEKDHYFVSFQIYESELLQWGDKQLLQAMDYLTLCKNVVESYGIRCVLFREEGSPPQKTRKGK